MKYALTTTTLALLTTLTSAHFELKYPTARGFDEDTLPSFPCGGQDTVSSTRTPWPLTGGSISLEMGHITSNVEVLIAIGNTPGSAFNTIIRPTFSETGLGAFCMEDLVIPSSLNITAGTNATIQVQTNGDPDGGLYNCADITFTANAPAPGSCTNGSVTISAATVDGHANGTKYGSEAEQSGSASTSGSATSTPTQSGSASGTAAAPASTSSKAAAAALNAGLGGVVLAGVAALAIVL